ncbi:heterokaryon incompatibility protein-domain-containing protein, partial [Immersiella caudata]
MEPHSTYSLSWPPGVPYINQSSAPSKSAFVQPCKQHEFGADHTAVPDASPHSEHVLSTIHENELSSNEFRLLCLTAEQSDDFPVRISLETYEDERYPEYECVSYTWGGEDGDDTLCRPAYIGPYWDVSLQTKNCWNMLTFLRPERGHRLIWVDAICINQQNVRERSAQVAKMGAIYSNCRRVVVYLGDDMANKTPGDYPVRGWIEDVVSLGSTTTSSSSSSSSAPSGHTKIDFAPILKRRYFSRAWIVQELLLSPQVAIQVGNTEIRLDSSTPWPDARQWSYTAVPWMQYVSKARISKNSFSDLIEMTADSSASDSRDKAFALLGLVSAPSAPRPDYSLPPLHIAVGIAAYCLLSERYPGVLQWASANPAGIGLPSWAP